MDQKKRKWGVGVGWGGQAKTGDGMDGKTMVCDVVR